MIRIIVIFSLTVYAIQATAQQTERYSPSWFGPNAHPVPELTDARINKNTTFDLSLDYYFGYGDRTQNSYFRIEIPLLSERIALKVWANIIEHFKVDSVLAYKRAMTANTYSGFATGDFYVQSKIRILKETDKVPNLILNYTLKTSSGSGVYEKRHFNTTGYYFDIETGKSFNIKSKIIDQLRVVGTIGFMCWETINYTQNDAPMYGLKIMIKKNRIEWEGGIRGYNGWMYKHPAFGSDFGDRPSVLFTKIGFKTNKINYYLQYQESLRDFPYNQLRVGIQFISTKLTPQYKND